MEQTGTFNCERFDCPQDNGDCSLCDRPRLTPDVFQILTIYRRCRQWKCLPSEGGLLKQDDRLMSLLDVVDNQVEHWRAKRIEDQRNDMIKENMASQMKGRRG